MKKESINPGTSSFFHSDSQSRRLDRIRHGLYNVQRAHRPNEKLPATALIRALILDSDEEILQVLGDTKELRATLEKDVSNNQAEAMIEIYKKIKPGDPPSLESAEPAINNLFFDPRRYDLAKVGRYKFNKKLGIRDRIHGHEAAIDVIDEETGEILVSQGEVITKQTARLIENAGINSVDVIGEGEVVRVVGNHFVELEAFELDFDVSDLPLSEKVYYPVMKEILDNFESSEERYEEIKKRVKELSPLHITPADILASMSYEFTYSRTSRRHRSFGKSKSSCRGRVVAKSVCIGLSRMESRSQRMSTQDPDLRLRP